MKNFQYDNFICNLGQNARENWILLDQANPNDYFFHLSAFPSGYVILETNGAEPTFDMIVTAAQLCKMHTKYYKYRDLKVDYCLCSNVSKGDIVGEVIFNSNRKVKQVKV